MIVSQAMIMNSKLWRIERIPNNLLNSSPSGINFSRALSETNEYFGKLKSILD